MFTPAAEAEEVRDPVRIGPLGADDDVLHATGVTHRHEARCDDGHQLAIERRTVVGRVTVPRWQDGRRRTRLHFGRTIPARRISLAGDPGYEWEENCEGRPVLPTAATSARGDETSGSRLELDPNMRRFNATVCSRLGRQVLEHRDTNASNGE